MKTKLAPNRRRTARTGGTSLRRVATKPVEPAPLRFRLKSILVPIDFSDCSRKALRYAIPFARQFGASLTLLHVVHVNYAVGGEMGIADFPLVEKGLLESTEKQLKELVREEVPEGISAVAQVYPGVPVQRIIEVAGKRNIDLIILATHGRTGLKHVLLGSTAENVVRRAPCPALVVREQERDFIEN